MDEGGVRQHRPLTSLLPGPGEQATPLLQNQEQIGAVSGVWLALQLAPYGGWET